MANYLHDFIPPNSLFPLFTKDKDLNVLLNELDKGLRSQKLHEQYESLLFFSKLINQHPHPVTINTAFLKLTDLFRVSNNFIRYYILQVFQQCQQHTNKILNVDEMLKRLYNVLLSNDPDARAITLRVFATIPTIIAERINIHHGIRNCIDTHHQVEVDATLHVMDKLCAVSPVFANGVLPKIITLLHSLSTSPKRKIHLIKLMRHMHHTTDIAVTAREALEKLHSTSITQPLIITLLHTLSYLAVKTRVHLSSHVSLLLSHIRDPRRAIQLLALKDLRWLGRISPHGLADPKVVDSLLALARESPYDDVIIVALDVVRVLTETLYTQILGVGGLDVCKEYLFHHNSQVADIASQILTSLFTNTSPSSSSSSSSSSSAVPSSTSPHVLSDLAVSLCIVITSRFGTKKSANSNYKTGFTKNSNIFHCIAKLVKHRPECAKTFTDSFVEILPRVSDEEAYLLIHNMTMYIPYNREALYPHASALHQFALKQTLHPKTLIGILILLERGYTHAVSQHDHLIKTHLLPLSLSLSSSSPSPSLSSSSLTCMYTLATHSLSHGYPSVATSLFQILLDKGQISSEPIFNWISTLASVARAEAQAVCQSTNTTSSIFKNLPGALADLHISITLLGATTATFSMNSQNENFYSLTSIPALSNFTFTPTSLPLPGIGETTKSLKTASSNSIDFRFQTAFVELRIAFLQALLALNKTLLTVPDLDDTLSETGTVNGNGTSASTTVNEDMSDGYEEEEIEEEMSGSVGMPIPTPTPAPVKPPVKKEKPVLDFTQQGKQHSHTLRVLAHRYSSLCAEFPQIDPHSVSVLESYELLASIIAYATDAVLSKSGPTTTPTLVLRLLETRNLSSRDPIHTCCMAILSQLHEIPVQHIYMDKAYLLELLFNVTSVPAVYPKFFIQPTVTPK